MSQRQLSKAEIEAGSTFAPRFDANGLIAAIVTDHVRGDVLMFAWMNEEALTRTLETHVAHFWSRSRSKLWRKGEESGNTLSVVEIATDCDQDVVLLTVRVEGDGVACHTGVRSCFYRQLDLPNPDVAAEDLVQLSPKRA
ncbi:MAG: phosphoribosyl-AMP cyclohydrolase [Pseudomonadota bacterium]